MNDVKCLRGVELRYALTMALAVNGPMTVPELVDELARQGFSVDGRASKIVSDALRWEIRRDRVRRHKRGRYGPGCMPRSTAHRIWQRVLALRAEAKLSLRGGQLDEWFEDVARGA
jgi:hypothetical protein